MATKKTSGQINIDDVRARFAQIRRDLGRVFREREAAIECITLAALAGTHALLLGPPGTAKSALFFGFLSSFRDARKFQTLVTKFQTEDEMFGPVKLSALKEDRWERNLAGRLAAVEFAFVDEVFKGSDAILNTLLQAMNERLYAGQPIPLRMIVGASNEMPADEGLAAMFDRFLLRDVVTYIGAEETWMDMVATAPSYAPQVFVSLDELSAACEAVGRVELPRPVVEAMLAIKKELGKVGIVVSDRRWIALTRVLRAAAWLDGDQAVSLDHLPVLAYGLWQTPEDRPKVAKILEAFEAGQVQELIALADGAIRAYVNRPSDRAAYHKAMPEIAGKVDGAIKGIEEQLSTSSGRTRAKVAPRLEELRGYATKMAEDVRARVKLPAFGAPRPA